MSISYTQAISDISAGGFTVSTLFDLVRSVSGAVEGADSQTKCIMGSDTISPNQSENPQLTQDFGPRSIGIMCQGKI